jgi:hypothetical protein
LTVCRYDITTIAISEAMAIAIGITYGWGLAVTRESATRISPVA